MTSAQVVETSVTNNSSFQNYTHPDDPYYSVLYSIHYNKGYMNYLGIFILHDTKHSLIIHLRLC